MAESLARPWIVNHLVEIAKKRGANIHDAPPLKQRRKVQITKFITFPPNDRPNDIIWALVSDKQYEIIVKISAPAVTAYNKENDVFGSDEDERRLTTRRFALATINDVKTFFARVPIGNGKGMSDIETIAFEVGDIRILGADHEGIFGNPASIESHEDIQKWISGLRKGGGGGNVLMRPHEEITGKGALDAPRRTELPLEKNVASEQSTVDTKAKPGATSPGKGVKQVDILREWKRKWKALHIRQFPPELQPILDQILVFGQEAPHCEQNANSEPLSRTPAESTTFNRESERRRETEPRTSSHSESQSASLHAQRKSLRAPLSPISQRHEPSTPTVWEPSEDDTPVKQRSNVLLPTPRRTRSQASLTPDRNRDLQQRHKDNAVYLAESSEEEHTSNDGKDDDSLSEDESAAESSFPAPTPAQRPKYSSGTIPRITQGDNGTITNRLDISQIAHSKVDSSQVISHSQSSQKASQPLQSQRAADMPSQGLYGGAPRILVPDSDTSVHVTSQSQSQSQSLPQSQSKSQSQFGSRSHPQPLRDSTNNSTQPSQAGDSANQEKHSLLSSHRCDDGSQQIPQSSGFQTNKRRIAKKTSLQVIPLSNSMATSHSESQSQANGVLVTRDSAPATLVEAMELPSPPPSLAQRAEETKDFQQSSSATQDDSQASRTEDSSLGQTKETKELDADDARTHRLLFGDCSEYDKQPKPIHGDGSSCSMREAYRLSHVQDSPTTRLGKRSHPSISSPPPLDDVNAERVHLQKKVRKASATDNDEATNAAHDAAHDTELWRAPSFLQRREKDGTQHASVSGEKGGNHSQRGDPSEKKGKQRERVLLGEQEFTDSRIMQSAISTTSVTDHPESSQAITSQSSSTVGTAKTASIATGSSRVNVEDGTEDHGLLDGFTSDLTLHRTPGGRTWLNWDDALRILARLNRRDFRE